MNSKERLRTAFNLQQPDRPPILGGWLSAPNHIQTLTGCTEEEYWAEPDIWEIAAEKILGSDGLIDVFQPASRGEYRVVDGHTMEARAQYTLESMLEDIHAMPDVDEIRSSFNPEVEYTRLVESLNTRQAQCSEMLWCPAVWDIIPTALWYGKYGYESALTAVALYPEEARKLIRTSAEKARLKATLLARAVREGYHPGVFLTGEDLCSQRGPMVSPRFLQKEYWHWMEYCWQPIWEAGGKIIWHCDGDVRPILPDILKSGVAGLQGFQRACGLELEWIVNLRTRTGNPLILFGPMEVATFFHDASPAEISTYVNQSIQLANGKASLCFFTSNTITPDIPLENIRAYWDAVHTSRW